MEERGGKRRKVVTFFDSRGEKKPLAFAPKGVWQRRAQKKRGKKGALSPFAFLYILDTGKEEGGGKNLFQTSKPLYLPEKREGKERGREYSLLLFLKVLSLLHPTIFKRREGNEKGGKKIEPSPGPSFSDTILLPASGLAEKRKGKRGGGVFLPHPFFLVEKTLPVQAKGGGGGRKANSLPIPRPQGKGRGKKKDRPILLQLVNDSLWLGKEEGGGKKKRKGKKKGRGNKKTRRNF